MGGGRRWFPTELHTHTHKKPAQLLRYARPPPTYPRCKTTRNLPAAGGEGRRPGMFVRRDASRSTSLRTSPHTREHTLGEELPYNVYETNLVSMLLITLFHKAVFETACCGQPHSQGAAGGVTQLMTRWRRDYVAGYPHTLYFTFQCVRR